MHRFLPAALLAIAATLHAQDPDPLGFTVEKIADGIYAAVRTEAPGLMFDANTVFIVNDEDVVVVDTNVMPSSAKATIAALRKVTTKPVKTVINTHWHVDHDSGNATYRAEFPGVEFIAHASALEDIPAVAIPNRKGMLEGAPGLLRQMKDALAAGQNLAKQPITDEERASYRKDIAQVERYLAEAPGVEVLLPTQTFKDRLTLTRGARTIELLHLGRAHSAADIVVHLPNEAVVITGDLVVSPVPLVGSTSYPREFATALDRLLELKAAAWIPGHGPVMRDDSYVRLNARLLHSLVDQTAAAAKRGETLAQARKSVNLDEFRDAFAGDSRLKRFIFSNYVAVPGVAAAYAQSSGGAADR